MTLTIPRHSDSSHGDDFFSLDGAPNLADAVFGTRPPLTPTTFARPLFDVPDVENAFELLNPYRTNPCYAGSCSYVVRSDESGMPSCLVGTIIRVLAPDYFERIKDETKFVDSLPGVNDVFTQRAIELLRCAQIHADGRHAVSVEPKTWGDAFANALMGVA